MTDDDIIVDENRKEALELLKDEPVLGPLERELFELEEETGNMSGPVPPTLRRREHELIEAISACQTETVGGIAWRLWDLFKVVSDCEEVQPATEKALKKVRDEAAAIARREEHRPLAPDSFALGGRQDDDAEILALFREWRAAWRASSRRGLSEDECTAACDVANGLAEQIYDAPVQGVVGLGLKAYMVGQREGDLADAPTSEHACTLGAFTRYSYSRRRVGSGETWTDVAHLYLGARALRGLLASAAAFVPELRPLVVAVVESPLTMPIEDEE